MIFHQFICALYMEFCVTTVEDLQIIFVCQHGFYFELDFLLNGLIVGEQLLLLASKFEN